MLPIPPPPALLSWTPYVLATEDTQKLQPTDRISTLLHPWDYELIEWVLLRTEVLPAEKFWKLNTREAGNEVVVSRHVYVPTDAAFAGRMRRLEEEGFLEHGLVAHYTDALADTLRSWAEAEELEETGHGLPYPRGSGEAASGAMAWRSVLRCRLYTVLHQLHLQGSDVAGQAICGGGLVERTDGSLLSLAETLLDPALCQAAYGYGFQFETKVGSIGPALRYAKEKFSQALLEEAARESDEAHPEVAGDLEDDFGGSLGAPLTDTLSGEEAWVIAKGVQLVVNDAGVTERSETPKPSEKQRATNIRELKQIEHTLRQRGSADTADKIRGLRKQYEMRGGNSSAVLKEGLSAMLKDGSLKSQRPEVAAAVKIELTPVHFLKSAHVSDALVLNAIQGYADRVTGVADLTKLWSFEGLKGVHVTRSLPHPIAVRVLLYTLREAWQEQHPPRYPGDTEYFDMGTFARFMHLLGHAPESMDGDASSLRQWAFVLREVTTAEHPSITPAMQSAAKLMLARQEFARERLSGGKGPWQNLLEYHEEFRGVYPSGETILTGHESPLDSFLATAYTLLHQIDRHQRLGKQRTVSRAANPVAELSTREALGDLLYVAAQGSTDEKRSFVRVLLGHAEAQGLSLYAPFAEALWYHPSLMAGLVRDLSEEFPALKLTDHAISANPRLEQLRRAVSPSTLSTSETPSMSTETNTSDPLSSDRTLSQRIAALSGRIELYRIPPEQDADAALRDDIKQGLLDDLREVSRLVPLVLAEGGTPISKLQRLAAHSAHIAGILTRHDKSLTREELDEVRKTFQDVEKVSSEATQKLRKGGSALAALHAPHVSISDDPSLQQAVNDRPGGSSIFSRYLTRMTARPYDVRRQDYQQQITSINREIATYEKEGLRAPLMQALDRIELTLSFLLKDADPRLLRRGLELRARTILLCEKALQQAPKGSSDGPLLTAYLNNVKNMQVPELPDEAAPFDPHASQKEALTMSSSDTAKALKNDPLLQDLSQEAIEKLGMTANILKELGNGDALKGASVLKALAAQTQTDAGKEKSLAAIESKGGAWYDFLVPSEETRTYVDDIITEGRYRTIREKLISVIRKPLLDLLAREGGTKYALIKPIVHSWMEGRGGDIVLAIFLAVALPGIINTFSREDQKTARQFSRKLRRELFAHASHSTQSTLFDELSGPVLGVLRPVMGQLREAVGAGSLLSTATGALSGRTGVRADASGDARAEDAEVEAAHATRASRGHAG